MCAVLFGGSSLKLETATMAATDPLERPSRTTGMDHSLSKGRLVSLKNSSQTQWAEVGFLKLSKWEAANQYFQMCIYHAGTKVTHKKSGKHRNRLAPCCPESRNGPDDLRVKEHFTKDGCLLNDRLQEGIQKGLLSNMQKIFNPGDGLLVIPLEVWCTIATSCSTTRPPPPRSVPREPLSLLYLLVPYALSPSSLGLSPPPLELIPSFQTLLSTHPHHQSVKPFKQGLSCYANGAHTKFFNIIYSMSNGSCKQPWERTMSTTSTHNTTNEPGLANNITSKSSSKGWVEAADSDPWATTETEWWAPGDVSTRVYNHKVLQGVPGSPRKKTLTWGNQDYFPGMRSSAQKWYMDDPPLVSFILCSAQQESWV